MRAVEKSLVREISWRCHHDGVILPWPSSRECQVGELGWRSARSLLRPAPNHLRILRRR